MTGTGTRAWTREDQADRGRTPSNGGRGEWGRVQVEGSRNMGREDAEPGFNDDGDRNERMRECRSRERGGGDRKAKINHYDGVLGDAEQDNKARRIPTALRNCTTSVPSLTIRIEDRIRPGDERTGRLEQRWSACSSQAPWADT